MEDNNKKTTEDPSGVDMATETTQSDDNAELDTCKKQAEEYLNNWKRERADFINYKKDEVKRLGEFVKFASESLILELLETIDDLYLAAKQVKDAGLDSAKLAGLEQVIKKIEDLLKKYGVEKIVVGDKFDPMYQETITTETVTTEIWNGEETRKEQETRKGIAEVQDKEEKIEEVRAGYTMHGRVIRPARVKVVKN